MSTQQSEQSASAEQRIEIIRGGPEHSEDILKLLREAAGWMESKGIKQWTPGQFSIRDVEDYFSSREVYLAMEGPTVAGMFTLQFSDVQYWGERNDESYAYLHRLAVAKSHRGGGLGGRMIRFAVGRAEEQGCTGLRLDTVAHNIKLNRYYQSLGFRYMGTHDVGAGRLVNLYEYEADYALMKEWSVSPEYLKKWAGPSLSYPLDDRQLERYLDGANHPAESGLLSYCAVLRATGQTVGHISLSMIDRENGSARISRVVVDPRAQGRGIGLQMVREALRIGFDALRLHRISLGVFDFNTSALKCYETAGFTREGISRETALFGGRYADCIEMGILDREWRVNRHSGK
jgi:RimJ/RimL family protein N-acetyltransferase